MSKTDHRSKSRYTWMLVALTGIMFVCMADESRAADYTWSNGVNSGSTFVTNPVSWNNASGAATNGFYLSNNALIFTNSYNQTGAQTFNWAGVNVQVTSAGSTNALTVSGYTNDVIMTNVGEWRIMSGNLLVTNSTGLTGKSAGTVYIYNTNTSLLGTSPTFAGNMGLFLGDLSGHGSSLRTVTQNLGSLCISNFGASAPNSSQTFTPGTMTANLTFNGSGTSTITGTIYSSRLTNGSGATNNQAFTVSSGTVNLATTNAANASTNSFSIGGLSSAYGWNSGLVITNNGSVYIGGQNSLGAQAWNIKMGTATGTTTFGVFGANEWATNFASTVSVTNNFDINNTGAGTNIFRGVAGKTLSLSGVIASANTNGTLVFQDGAITLSGANTFSNLAVVNNSAVTLSGANASLGNTNAAIRITGTGALDLGGVARTNGAFTLDTGTLSNGTLTASSYALTNAGTVSAILSGSGALTKSGAGTAILTASNNYSGGTTISAGSLQLGDGGASGMINGNVINNGTLVFNRSDSNSFANLISGSGGVTVNSGTITLGNTNNSFTGNINVNNGATLSFNQWGTNASGAPTGNHSSSTTATTSSSSWMVLNGGTVQYTGSGETFGGGITAGILGATIDASGTGAINLNKGNGGLLLGGDQSVSRTLTIAGTNTGANTLNWNLTNGSSGGVVTLNKTGSGTWRVSGSGNFSGGVDVRQGTIEISSASQTASFGSGTIRIYDGATFKNSGTTPRGFFTNSFNLGGTNNMDQLVISGATTLTNDTVLNTILTNNTGLEFTANGIGESGGPRSLRKTGVGALTLSASNSYSGGTTLSLGFLNVTGTGTLGASGSTVTITGGTLDLGNTSQTNGTFTIGGGVLTNGTMNATSFALTNAGTVSAVLAGSGALTKSGAGTATLSGANTYSGGTLVSMGTLVGDSTSLQGLITNNATVTFNQATNGTYSGVMSGTGLLSKTNSGSLTLFGANSYSGGTLVSAGTLIGDTTSLQRSITNNASVTFNQSTNGTYAGVMSGTGLLSKTNSGTLILSGANSYDGVTAVNAGVLNIQNGSALGSTTGGTTVAAGAQLQLQGGITVGNEALALTLGDGTTATLRNISGNNIYNGAITFSGSGINRIDSDTGTLTLSSFANGLSSTRSLLVGGAGNTTLSGSFTGSSSGTLTKDGAGTLTLAATNFQINGGIIVNAGTLALGTNNAVGATTDVTVNAGTLSITSYNNTMGAVTVTNGGRITGLTGILTGSSYASGVVGATNTIGANLAGTGGLTLTGNNNTTVLSGSNTYSGDTLLNSTTSTNMTLRVTSTTALSTNSSISGSTSILRTPTLDLAAGNYVLQAYKSGNLNFMATNGNATFTFTNVAANATANDMTGGSKEIYASNVNIAFAGGMDITGNQNKTATYSGNSDFTFNGGITNANNTFTNNVEFATTGMVTLNASNNYNGLTTFSSAGGTLVLGNNNALGATNIGTIISDGAALDLNGKEISDEALTIQGTGVSSGGAIKNSSANAATWSGAVTLNTNTTVNVTNGAITISGAVGEANTASLTKAGTGLLTLLGANTYSGGTLVSAGTLIGDTTSLQRTITNNGTVTFNQATNGTYSGVMSGTGLLSKTNSGTLTLSGANAYSGATTVNQGTLLVAANGSIASSSLATVNGGLLQVNGTAGAVTVNRGGSLGGSGTVGEVTLKDGSFLKPGNSPGLLTASLATWEAGSTYNWEIDDADGTAGTNWDLFSVTGALDLSALSSSAKMNLVLESLSTVTNFSATNPDSWVFAQAGSLVGTAFTAGADVTDLFNINATAFNGGTGPANGWRIEVGASGNTLNLMAVPEPSTGSMLGLGLAGLVVTRLLRRKNS